MSKLTVLLGRNIHSLAADSHRLLPVQTPYTFYFPELGYASFAESGRKFAHPLHADDYVRQTLQAAKGFMLKGSSVVILTQSEQLVNELGGWVHDHKLDSKQVEILLYNDDNSNHRRCTFDENGHLQNWPFGWFMMSYH